MEQSVNQIATNESRMAGNKNRLVVQIYSNYYRLFSIAVPLQAYLRSSPQKSLTLPTQRGRPPGLAPTLSFLPASQPHWLTCLLLSTRTNSSLNASTHSGLRVPAFISFRLCLIQLRYLPFSSALCFDGFLWLVTINAIVLIVLFRPLLILSHICSLYYVPIAERTSMSRTAKQPL